MSGSGVQSACDDAGGSKRTDARRYCSPPALLAGCRSFLAGTSAQLGLTDPQWFGSLQLHPSNFALLCFVVIALQGAIIAAVLLTGGRLAAIWTGARALGVGRIALLFLLLLGSTVAPMGFLSGA